MTRHIIAIMCLSIDCSLIALLCNFEPGVDALIDSRLISLLLPLVRGPVLYPYFSLRAVKILDAMHTMRQGTGRRATLAHASEDEDSSTSCFAASLSSA